MKNKTSLFIFWGVAACFLAQSHDVFAHGTGHRLLNDVKTTAVEFHYSDNTPMAYAEVLVFSPGNREIEFQNGRTDKNGVFVFCPDAAGKWSVTVSDGMGHAAEAAVSVQLPEKQGGKAPGQDHSSETALSASSSKTMKIITGLSLIMNLAFALYLVKFRSKKSAA
jgi:nickel transport protein